MIDLTSRFDDLGRLLLPAGGGQVVHAGEAWRRLPETSDMPVVWGRSPAASGQGVRAQAAHAIRRVVAARRVARNPGLDVREAHRLAPGRLDRAGVREQIRARVLAGRAVELRPPGDDRPHVLDDLLAGAGAARAGPLHANSAGGVTVGVTGAREPAIARAGRAGGPADPAPEVAALHALGGLDGVPTILAEGDRDGVAWCVEERLPGATPDRLPTDLVHAVTSFLSALPRSGATASAHRRDLSALARALPQHARTLDALRDRLDRAAGQLPAMARHGDLWRGNLLASGTRLTGVVDWDAWAPDALPGTDLLQLLLTEVRHATRASLAVLWRDRLWEAPAVAGPLHEQLRQLGVAPDPAILDAVVTAWWAAEVAGTLRRRPERATDGAWLAGNVDPVMADLPQP